MYYEIILIICMPRKPSASEIESTLSTGEMKSVCETHEGTMPFEDTTLGDMVDEKEKISEKSPKTKKLPLRRLVPQKKWSPIEIKRLHKCV